MSLQNEAAVKAINDAFAENNVEAFLDQCHDDVTWTMIGNKVNHGKDEIRRFMSGHPEMEPPKFTVEDLFSSDERVVCWGDMTMNNEIGEEKKYSYCDIYNFRNGKVTDFRSFVVKLNS